jgi:hypothetical protein
MAIPERAKSHAWRLMLQRVAGKTTDNTMKKNVEEMFLWKTVDVKIEQEEGSARRWEETRSTSKCMDLPQAKAKVEAAESLDALFSAAKDRVSIQRRRGICGSL